MRSPSRTAYFFSGSVDKSTCPISFHILSSKSGVFKLNHGSHSCLINPGEVIFDVICRLKSSLSNIQTLLKALNRQPNLSWFFLE